MTSSDSFDDDLARRASRLRAEEPDASRREISAAIGVSEDDVDGLIAQRHENLQRVDVDTLKVFISHHHDDAALATALQETLVDWGIPREQVWSSSDPTTGVTPGGSIPQEIKDFLFEANLVLWVFTSSDKNWMYPSWEIGLAEQRSVPTRIVTFQMLGAHEPTIRPASKRITVTESDILSFVKSLHTSDDFFPGFQAWQPRCDLDQLRKRARALHQHLHSLTSNYASGEVAHWGSVTLMIEADSVERCRKLLDRERVQSTSKGLKKELQTTLVESLKLVDVEGWGAGHFGYGDASAAIEATPSLAAMIKQWRAVQKSRARFTPPWAKDLVDEIWRTVMNEPPRLNWRPVKSVHGSSPFFHPVLTRYWMTNSGNRRFRIHTLALDSSDDLTYNPA